MERNWNKLYENKCPVVGCVTKGKKTNLTDNGWSLKCPKCGGEWVLEIPTPMDITWMEIKKPVTNE